jgi:hypothetical protein
MSKTFKRHTTHRLANITQQRICQRIEWSFDNRVYMRTRANIIEGVLFRVRGPIWNRTFEEMNR